MGYLRAKDTVNGALGTCFAIIEGEENQNDDSYSGDDRKAAEKRRLGRHRDDDGILCEQFVSQGDGGLYEKRRGHLF